MDLHVLNSAVVSLRLVVNLFGVGLLAIGVLAMFWPVVLPVSHPLRWVFFGLAVALAGFLILRI